MDQVVTTVDAVTDGCLDTLGLEPWLAVWIVDVGVGSEEWIVHTQLVEHHPEILSWLTVESWDIRSTEWMSCITELQDHGE